MAYLERKERNLTGLRYWKTTYNDYLRENIAGKMYNFYCRGSEEQKLKTTVFFFQRKAVWNSK